MLSYHSDPKLKAVTVAEITGHREAGRLIKGTYWYNGKGSAVGCLLKSSYPLEYEKQFGIPVALARLEDAIFGGLPNHKAMLWPERFMGSVPVGVDLSRVHWHFLYWLLTKELKVVGDGEIYDNVNEAIKRCAGIIAPLKDGNPVSRDTARAARIYACIVADDADRAATYVVRAAAYAAAYAARSVADSAWRAAAYAAYADADAPPYPTEYVAADDVAQATIRAADAVAYSATYATVYDRMADKLIEIIKKTGDK